MKNSLTQIMVLILIGLNVAAQQPLEKTYTEHYDIGTSGAVNVQHRYGSIRIEQIAGSQAKLSVVLKAEKGSADDFQTVVNNFDLGVNHSGSRLSISTGVNIENINTKNDKTTIEFKNGDKVKSIKELSVDLFLQIPKVSSLEISNKYDKVYLSDIEGDVTANLYNADLEGGNITGDFKLGVKYSKVEVKNVHHAKLDLYDSNLQMGNAQKLKLKSKYSKIEMGDLDQGDLNTYDDNIEMGNVKGELNIEDKYSDFEIGNFAGGNWKIYDAVVEAGSTNKLELTSKYSEYEFKEIRELAATNVYDDVFKIGMLGDLQCTSKYGEFDIDQFSGTMKINSYDDQIDVDRVMAGFKGLTLTGKYTEMNFPIPSDMAYVLQANMTYGKVEYDDGKLENNLYLEKNSKVEIKAKTKGAGANAPVVNIDHAYDCKIKLK